MGTEFCQAESLPIIIKFWIFTIVKHNVMDPQYTLLSFDYHRLHSSYILAFNLGTTCGLVIANGYYIVTLKGKRM